MQSVQSGSNRHGRAAVLGSVAPALSGLLRGTGLAVRPGRVAVWLARLSPRHDRVDTADMTTWQLQMDQLVAAFHDAHPFGRATIRLAGRLLNVLVASTPEQWARGMTGRTFADTDGMLFIMPKASTLEFSTASVDFGIDIMFFDADYQLVDVGVMAARKGRKKAKGPYLYALELPARGHDRHDALGLSVGFSVESLQAQVDKVTKTVANYRPADTDNMTCGLCRHYDGGTCEVVEGSISPTAVSDFFHPRTMAMDPDPSMSPTAPISPYGY